jgi:hypothetical protein
MNTRHLSDSEHHDAISRMLDDVRGAAELDAEDAFPLERLALQRDRILARVDDLCRAGKVLTFPSTHARVVASQPTHRTRWVAAAAAAGLVVGLLGGHLTRDFSSRPSLQSRHGAAATGVTLRPVRPTLSDDELLGQVEVVFEGTGPSALRALDAVTPVAWDVH